MIDEMAVHQLLATVDVRDLETVRWGPMRVMFPSFVEEIELARYLKTLLSGAEICAVAIEPRRDANGRPSTHVFDVYRVEHAAARRELAGRLPE
jgi:hypothetical protein